MGTTVSKKKKEQMREHAKKVLELLVEEYTEEYRCYLNHENAWQLLFATILSAQCTDARVNIVTADLFQKYRSVEAFAAADLSELEEDIRPTGFYHNKAKNIIGCARMLLEKHGGEVPDTIEELTELPGVGRKTANVIRGNIYHQPSIVVDTHVKRISKKLGFTKEEDPEKIEFALMEILPEEYWILLCKLNGKVKTCLTSQTRNNCIGTLVAYNLCNILQCEWLHIDLIGNIGVGHNCCGVRVHKNNLVTLLLQCQARLSTCIIELSSLTNDNRAGADYHYFLYICSSRHFDTPPSV